MEVGEAAGGGGSGGGSGSAGLEGLDGGLPGAVCDWWSASTVCVQFSDRSEDRTSEI
jgi:hypothetical protein